MTEEHFFSKPFQSYFGVIIFMALYKADHVIERQFTNKLAKFVDLSRYPEELEPLSEDFKLNQHKFEVIHKHLDVGPDLYRVQEEIETLSENIYSSSFLLAVCWSASFKSPKSWTKRTNAQ